MKKDNKIEWISNTHFITRCDCLSPEHDMHIEVEKDTEMDMLSIAIIMELSLKNTYYNTFWRRLKVACRILFNKEVTYDSEFIFRGYEHARDFCDGVMRMANRLKKD